MSSGHSIAKRRTNEDEVRRYPVNRLCALAGVTRQAFYKRDEDALLARLAIEQFVVQSVLEVRVKDPKTGMDKLWRMYGAKFPEEYRVGRDVFRSILHERGLNLRHRPRAIRTTDSRHNLPTYPNLVKSVLPMRPNHIWVSDITYIMKAFPTPSSTTPTAAHSTPAPTTSKC